MKFMPHDWQMPLIEAIINHDRRHIGAPMGSGKTGCTLLALTWMLRFGLLTGKVLVIAPLPVARDVWPGEIVKWEDFSHLRFASLTGGLQHRRALLKCDADIYTINYENIPWLFQELKWQGRDWPFEMVIADESTKLKNLQVSYGVRLDGSKYLKTGSGSGIRTAALAPVAHAKTKRWINLTGLDAPNGIQDLWGQLWFIDAGVALGRSVTAFRDKYMRPASSGFGFVPLPGGIEQVRNAINPIVTRIVPPITPDPIITDVQVSLTAAQMAEYKRLERDCLLAIEGEQLDILTAGAKTQKCLQYASGGVWVDREKNISSEVHAAKLDALESIIEEACGAPVLVAYQFRCDIDRLKKRFKQGVEYKGKKEETAWNNGEIPVMFIHPAAAGHGINLQHGGNILVFFTVDWNLDNYAQVIERIGPLRQMQSGHPRSVFIYRLLARGTIDEWGPVERLKSKREVVDILRERKDIICKI